MTRSYFTRSLFAAAAFAASACLAVAHIAFAAVYAVGYFVKALALSGIELAGNKDASARRAVIWFVWAKAFTMRIARRQRPLVSSSWRMCPST